MTDRLVYLKLGGSLITDKDHPHTPRLDVLGWLAGEIAEARSRDKDLKIVLGHGSGSFGHVPASRYKTRQGVRSAEEWVGFVEVWREATALNHLVMRALEDAGIPALAFPPLAMVIARQGKVSAWNLDGLHKALAVGLLPVIHGDVVFDTALGGTILSTEDLFAYLATQIPPSQVLFAGNQPGVWADFPQNTRLLDEITPGTITDIGTGLRGSASTDVTGGMADKVRQVITLVQAFSGVKALIFSGEVPGNLRRALLGETLGTQVHA